MASSPAATQRLLAASRDAENLVHTLGCLPALAADDRPKEFAAMLLDCRGLLDNAWEPIQRWLHELNRLNPDPNRHVQVGARYFRTAHEAAVVMANAFFDRLWFALDPEGRDQAMKESLERKTALVLRTGFTAKLADETWQAAKGVVADWFTPDNRAGLNALVPGIQGERAHGLPEQDEFQEVVEFAVKQLSGGQRRLVDVLLEKGKVPVEDIGVLINSKDPFSTKRHANKKLLAIHWEIGQHDGAWFLRRVSAPA